MGKKPSTFGLNQAKLAELWSMGSDAAPAKDTADDRQQKADLLRDYLGSSPPLDADLVELLPQVLSRVCRELRPFVGESFGSVLLDPEADVVVLKRIKDLGKKMVESATSEANHDAATALYYAAIAAALVFHDRRITSFSYDNLAESFTTMLDSGWLTAELTDLFGKARDACLAKCGKPGKDRAK